MKSHKYKVSVSHVEDKEATPLAGDPFEFMAESHDEILEIIGRIQGTRQFPGDDAAALAVGLKLFGGVMLKNRDHPLFEDFMPQFIEFMKRLKRLVRGG